MVMLSRASNELARRSTWTCLSCTAFSVTPAALITAQRRLPHQRHQRKNSSSKASSSSKEYPRNLAAPADPATKSTAQATTAASHNGPEASRKSSSGRTSKRKSKTNARNMPDNEEPWVDMNLPFVPSTQNLHPLNVHLASFFSTHRPLSITNAIPPSTSTSAFSSLFDAKPPLKPNHADVIYTLASAAHELDNISNHQSPMTPEELDLRGAVTQASSSNAQSNHDQDIPAKSFVINMQDLAKRFRPYTPPPPPVPLGALKEAAGDIAKAETHPQPPLRKSYKTTLTIYESTHSNGQRTYDAFSTPITMEPNPPDHGKEFLPWTNPRGQPFLGRMRERQVRYEDRLDERFGNGTWHLISVRRQRKLKMKKHKLKKLRRKTLQLRRKLGHL